MSKTARIGITIIILLASISVYLFISQSGVEGNEPTSKKVDLDQKEPETLLAKIDSEMTETSSANVTGDNEEDKEDSTTEAVKVEESKTENGGKELGATKAPEDEKKELQKDFLVVIDPGHQQQANLGQEPVGPGASETKIKVTGGTSGVATGKPEYKLTLEASLILGEILEERGMKVIYTRTTHDVNMSNKERAEIANQNKADLFVRIHADGSTNRNVKGLSVLTPSEDAKFTKVIFQESLKASQLIIDETKKNPALKVNGISYRGDLSGFNWSKVPSTLVEMGFMSNPTEDKNLSNTGYLTNLLTNVADGITLYSSSKN
jgi:N-acetylmuramoyl-L-alanine amidase